MRLDGRVAIVTGAGGNPGLGRSHAHLLAARGARVLVNDLGVGPDGHGTQPHRAEAVAAEIRAAGGEAIANAGSVADAHSAREIVQAALEEWGRLDILVNNAGIETMGTFEEVDPRDVEAIVRVHVLGMYFMCRAAWEPMKEAGYGRIVNTSSAGAFGYKFLSAYGTAKAGIFGLTRNLSAEGTELGILVNSLGPQAGTSATTFLAEGSGEWFDAMFTTHPPELVSPMVLYLSHEDCDCAGRYFEVGGGNAAEIFVSATKGISSPDLSAEEIRDRIAEITDRDGAVPMPDPSEPVDPPFRPRPYVAPPA
jgi:NAD(P)-dependent dehydrogenase (short-subunit alcohol dehydrogenase family)